MSMGGRKGHKSTTPSPTTAVGQRKPRGLCRQMDDCVSMATGICTSKPKQQQKQQPNDHHRPISTTEQQVLELQREKELRVMYKKKLERTQEYLRYCLQIAQENGFLDLIVGNQKDGDQKEQPFFVPSHYSPVADDEQPNSNLSVMANEARLNGWYIHPNEIHLQEQIGKGSTAQIHRALWRGLDVAVKCIDPALVDRDEGGGTAFFMQEVATLSRQRHPFVLRLLGACMSPPSHCWIVTEVLTMTLKDWLHGLGKRSKDRLVPLPPLGERLSKALEIAQAMQHLHEQNPKVVHRDLKPSNIFLDSGFHVRVADFGHARFLNDEKMALTGETGTYVYMAPEVIRCEPYNEKCDVYSFGVILNELVTGNHPYIEIDHGPARIAMEVGEGNLRPALAADMDTELLELIELSWHEHASVRPSFASITPCLRKIIKENTSLGTYKIIRVN